MTTFDGLSCGDIALRDGGPVIVCDQPHPSPAGLAVTAQRIDDERMPIGFAEVWTSPPDEPVTVLRHHGRPTATPEECHAEPRAGEVVAANGVPWRDPENPAEQQMAPADEDAYRAEQADYDDERDR